MSISEGRPSAPYGPRLRQAVRTTSTRLPKRRRRCAVLGRAIGLAAVLSLLVSAGQASPQVPVVLDTGPDHLVTSTGEEWPIVEPMLAVHPEDPDHLLVAAMVPRPALPEVGDGLSTDSGCSTWLSHDGGDTWTRHDHPVSGCGDPWVLITPDGVAVFAALGHDGMSLFRSTDGGANWDSHPFRFGVGHDHPTLVAAGRDSPGATYLASSVHGTDSAGRFRWMVYVAWSGDGATSFPRTGRALPSNLSYEAHLPAVLSDGTLVVPFTDHHTIDLRRLSSRRSWLLRSSDRGRTFSEPLFITDECDGRGGWPSLVSTPADGLLFVCNAGEHGGVFVFRSDDRGESWSGPVRADSGGENAHTAVPTAGVSSNGTIAVSWYDRRDDPNRLCQYTRLAVSLDGGQSFGPDVRISSEPSCPDSAVNGWTAARFPAGGDYAGLVAISPDEFRAVWSDARDGLYRLRTTQVRVRR